MDVYVLVEDGRVLGASRDLECAMQIADRRGETDWEIWHPFTDSWARSRGPYENSWRLTQQIVRVPLAGGEEPKPRWDARAEIEEIGRTFGAP